MASAIIVVFMVSIVYSIPSMKLSFASECNIYLEYVCRESFGWKMTKRIITPSSAWVGKPTAIEIAFRSLIFWKASNLESFWSLPFLLPTQAHIQSMLIQEKRSDQLFRKRQVLSIFYGFQCCLECCLFQTLFEPKKLLFGLVFIEISEFAERWVCPF